MSDNADPSGFDVLVRDLRCLGKHSSGEWISTTSAFAAEVITALRERLATLARERDDIRTILNAVLNIPNMSDAQLEQLRQNAKAATAPNCGQTQS